MAAIRLARGITGREDIVAFDGSYHGAHDQLLARRAPGEATSPSSRGVCPAAVSTTHLATFNDIEKTADLVRRTRAAAVIAEPVMGNMGCILPEDGFLSELRAVCTEEGALLILDEVITGFRLAPGGAQEHFGVAADIATYGKVAGGGLPIGLVAGSREVMEHLSPTGPVYNAGTFNGNPLSMAAGCAALAELRTHDALARIATHTKELVSAVSDILPPDAVVCSCPGMFQVYFGTSGVHNAEDARAADGSRYLSFQQALFSEGVFLPPSMHESNFLSAVHDAVDIEQTIAAMERALL
jgi:glutamate-1-semialdehyde 2,1-aminomutase